MKEFKHTLSFCLPREQGAFLKRALGPETEDLRKCRVRWEDREGQTCLVIEAEDLHTLRASLNSYMRWANVALGVLKMLPNSSA
ncbi:MAG: hypothetical protein KIY11_06105 [Thermoplasmata archaeon]|nr:hypothetical protein [Candidatus Sysuiplasma acidicola]